ncbi:MAG TPA: hypothetical protein VJ942_16265 [Roseovarius sp.]|nr:hypothetical protein [Roseovarius sp.]
MRQHPPSPYPLASAGVPKREDLLQEAIAGHWPGEAWLEKVLDRMEARR